MSDETPSGEVYTMYKLFISDNEEALYHVLRAHDEEVFRYLIEFFHNWSWRGEEGNHARYLDGEALFRNIDALIFSSVEGEVKSLANAAKKGTYHQMPDVVS